MGNSFNLVQEMTKIYRLMQESQVPGLKRLDALNQALHQLSIQMISNPDKAIDEFNRYGGNKNWKMMSELLKYQEPNIIANTLKILNILCIIFPRITYLKRINSTDSRVV